MTANLWSLRGPVTEFGNSYLAQEVNEVVFGSGGEGDAFGYVSDMNAFPEIVQYGTLRLRTAESDLCELVGEARRKPKGRQSLERRPSNSWRIVISTCSVEKAIML
jgi:hypothetical protein